MKKKVLLITQCGAYPLSSGGGVAQYYFVDGLRHDVDFVYFILCSSPKEIENFNIFKEKNPTIHAYCFNQSPVAQKKNAIRELGCRIKRKIFKPKGVESVYCDDDYCDPYFLRVDHNYSDSYIQYINQIIEKESVDVVQMDFYETIDLVFALPPEVKKVFVCHEVRHKRLLKSYGQSNLLSNYKQFILNKNRVYEMGCLAEMDRVIVFNEDDAQIVRNVNNDVVVSPFAIPDELILDRQVSKSFKHFIFVGGEGHTPNKCGMEWFLDTIYIPNIDAIKYDVLIVGRWTNLFMQKYKDYSRIRFMGFVDSLADYYSESILINPILSGAGLRTKVLQTLANKVPVFSTRFGAEGCYDERNQDHLFFFEDAESFLMCNEMTDEDIKIMAMKGYLYYQKAFSKEELLSRRLNALKF